MSASLIAGILTLLLVACEGAPLAPRPGLPEYRELSTVALPGPARLDVAGGNLLVSRTDLDLDTQLGPFSVGAVWNSATRRWTWNFDGVSFANGSFTDAMGATHLVGDLAPGAAIPGTIWVKKGPVDPAGAQRLRTKGGHEYAFTPSGRLQSIRWASSSNPRLQFTQTVQGDGELHTSAIDQCIGATPTCHPVFTIDYDDSGRVREIVDRAGRRALFSYDAFGHLVTARDGLDIATNRPGYRYEYIGEDLSAITNSEGERVEYQYDTARRVVQAMQIGEGNPTRIFEYRGKNGSDPYRTIMTDSLGAVSVYRYDSDHQLLSIENSSVGETTAFTWKERRVTSRTSPDGTTTHWVYSNDDVSLRVDPSGNITSYVYHADGVDRALPGRRPLRSRTDWMGTTEERSYDAAGRLLSVTNGAGDTLSLEYGADEMVSSFTDPAGIRTSLSGYGEHGHATVATRSGITQTFGYDAVGNVTEGPDLTSRSGPGLGGILSRRFDEDRNVTVVSLENLALVPLASETIATAFRSDRRPLLTARPGGGDDVFVYDGLGRLVRRSERADGAWRNTTFEYDAVGRITAVDRGNGMSQQWTHDSLGRVTSHVIRSATAPESFAAFAYASGRLRLYADSHSGTEVYSYDEAGRPAGVVYGNGDQATLFWDLRSQQTGVALQRGDGSTLRTLSIAYDDAGRERGIYDNGVPVIERAWSEGRLARTSYGNGLVREFLFDPDLGVLSGSVMAAGSMAVESTSVEMASAGCNVVATRCVSSQTTIGGAVPTTNSERHHLMPRESGSVAGKRVGYEDQLEGGHGHLYHYDFLSNLRFGPAGTLQYNQEGNQLERIERDGAGPIEYEYDAAGFATSRAGVPLSWDGAGRVSSYGSATFVWDSLGRPVSSTVDGVHTTRRFGGLIEADAAGTPRAIDLGEVRIDLMGTETRYRHFDYRGNVKLVTDASGEVVKHYQYSSYGVRAALGADNDSTNFARGHTVGDLVLIGHRLYDAAAARFLAPDPIHQLINQYAYTLGNPVQFWDPSGAQAVTNDQAAGAMMQAAGNVLSIVGAVALGAGVGALFVPAAAATTVVALIGIGANLVVLGEGLKGVGSLLESSGGGSIGFSGGFGSGPGLSAPSSLMDNIGPPPDPCGGDACAGGAGSSGLGGLGALAGINAPSAGVGGGGGGCAPISLAEGRLPKGSFGLLLFANLAVASIVWRSARVARRVARET